MSRGFHVVPILAAGLFLAACGVKTPPYPALDTLPGPVLDLRQSLDEQANLTLSWRPPEHNMAGRPLKKLGGFEIEMADETADADYCEDCPHRFRKVDLTPAAPSPPGRELAPGPYAWRRALVPGHVYHFRVAGVSPNGGLHPRAFVETTVWVLSEPGRPAGFRAGLEEKAVALSWSRPPAGLLVELEKREPDGPWQKPPDFDPALGRYMDLNVAYGRAYVYRARLTAAREQSLTPGPWSPELRVEVADLTPPPPAAYLDAAQTGREVRLSWQSQADTEDLAGYRLYRQVEGEPGFVRIGPPLVNEATFVDRPEAAAGLRVRYEVTAVDASPRANESRPSPAAEILFEPDTAPPSRPEAVGRP